MAQSQALGGHAGKPGVSGWSSVGEQNGGMTVPLSSSELDRMVDSKKTQIKTDNVSVHVHLFSFLLS